MAPTSAQEALARLRENNVRLRNAIRDVSNRQELLEEFIDLEHNAEEFKTFLKNRERLMYALGYSKDDVNMPGGKRSPKSSELVRLLKVVKKHKKLSFKPKRKNNNWTSHPVELAPFRIFINTQIGVVERRPPKRCEVCYDESHERRDCPYKYAESRTPEVKEMIKERIERIAEVEIHDPFLSAKYKKRHFKFDPIKEAKVSRWKKQKQELMALKKVLDEKNKTPAEVLEQLNSSSSN